MNHLLHIDTSRSIASVCLTRESELLGMAYSDRQHEPASWLHAAIRDLLKQENLPPADLNGISVTLGPGSYTGLRVGLAAAKGLCYASQRPLITVGTLQVMAAAVREETGGLIIPMIDARRMEVFSAVYNSKLEEIIPSGNRIVGDHFLAELPAASEWLFCGDGREKLRQFPLPEWARFSNREADAATLAQLALEKFRRSEFSDLAYTDPFYGKAFYSGPTG
jgi:tRNA threonylcarbamoyladenosine biosynthesis protein TsaB